MTRSVTINAAFLQEIKEDNLELRQLLEHSKCVFQPSAIIDEPPRALVDLLSRLRDQLALHFSLEEAYGYFEDAVSVAPRLSHEADQLRAQHKTLFNRVCQLVEEAERLLYHEGEREPQLRRLTRDLAAFHDVFEDHELRENDLITQALEHDIGVGD